jgi:hypothetical protein
MPLSAEFRVGHGNGWSVLARRRGGNDFHPLSQGVFTRPLEKKVFFAVRTQWRSLTTSVPTCPDLSLFVHLRVFSLPISIIERCREFPKSIRSRPPLDFLEEVPGLAEELRPRIDVSDFGNG